MISHAEPAAKEATGYVEMSEDFKGPLREKRDRTILAVLLGCGLRRAETVAKCLLKNSSFYLTFAEDVK